MHCIQNRSDIVRILQRHLWSRSSSMIQWALLIAFLASPYGNVSVSQMCTALNHNLYQFTILHLNLTWTKKKKRVGLLEGPSFLYKWPEATPMMSQRTILLQMGLAPLTQSCWWTEETTWLGLPCCLLSSSYGHHQISSLRWSSLGDFFLRCTDLWIRTCLRAVTKNHFCSYPYRFGPTYISLLTWNLCSVTYLNTSAFTLYLLPWLVKSAVTARANRTQTPVRSVTTVHPLLHYIDREFASILHT